MNKIFGMYKEPRMIEWMNVWSESGHTDTTEPATFLSQMQDLSIIRSLSVHCSHFKIDCTLKSAYYINYKVGRISCVAPQCILSQESRAPAELNYNGTKWSGSPHFQIRFIFTLSFQVHQIRLKGGCGLPCCYIMWITRFMFSFMFIVLYSC